MWPLSNYIGLEFPSAYLMSVFLKKTNNKTQKNFSEGQLLVNM